MKFTIEATDLIKGYYTLTPRLSNSFMRLNDIFNDSINVIGTVLQQKPLGNLSPSAIASMLDFLAFYEKLVVASEIGGHPLKKDAKGHVDHTLDSLLKLKNTNNTDMRFLRNIFSHNFDFALDSIQILDRKNNLIDTIGFWDWLYASDTLRIITYCLVIETMFQSQIKQS